MHEPDAAVRRVLVLPTLAPGAEGLDAAFREEFIVVFGWWRWAVGHETLAAE